VLTQIERVQRAEIADILVELYTQRAEACGQEDWHRVRTIERKLQDAADYSAGRLSLSGEALL
jgi:hypothetical protein